MNPVARRVADPAAGPVELEPVNTVRYNEGLC